MQRPSSIVKNGVIHLFPKLVPIQFQTGLMSRYQNHDIDFVNLVNIGKNSTDVGSSSEVK